MPADTRLWHAFADMHAVRGNEFVIARGDGAYVWDEDGNAVPRRDGEPVVRERRPRARRDRRGRDGADARAGQLPDVRRVRQSPALDLAERLADLAPLDDPRIFLGSGGGDAIDTAAKLARRYFAAIGTPERTHLISRSQGYHGTHGMGTSIGGIPANRQDVGPLDPDASVVPYDSLEALEAEIERVGADRVAAVFVEPVIGAGGVRQPAPGYIEGVAELCARTGVLFVCDSVIAGFGRLGTWFGIERWDVRPDMLTFAKGVTSGYLPLGGVVVGAKVAAPFWEDGAWFRHGPTYSGHPTVCAAAMANLDIIEREGLLDRGRELEDEIAPALRPLGDHPLVGEIRTGIGALGAIAFAARGAGRGARPAGAPVRGPARARRPAAPAGRRAGLLAAAGDHPRAGRARRGGRGRGARGRGAGRAGGGGGAVALRPPARACGAARRLLPHSREAETRRRRGDAGGGAAHPAAGPRALAIDVRVAHNTAGRAGRARARTAAAALPSPRDAVQRAQSQRAPRSGRRPRRPSVYAFENTPSGSSRARTAAKRSHPG